MIGNVLETDVKIQRDRAKVGIYRRFAKRLIDLIIVLLTLPTVLPIVIVIAVLIKLDGGPAFYSQARVGQGGRIFRMWKLRSMVEHADCKLQALLDGNAEARKDWQERQKLRCDPRITPIGRLIRKTSLDELPQVWNVLLGDMSLVGPRPFLPEQSKMYVGQDYYELRPGLTGLWQVTDRNGTSFRARVIYDSRYNEQLSLRMDLQIMMETVAVILRGTGC